MTLTCSRAFAGRLVLPLMACLACTLNSAARQNGRAEEFKPWHEVRAWRVQPHEDTVRALAFSPDGKRLASGSYDHTIAVMQSPQDLRRRSEVLLRIPGHVFPVTFLTFDRDGKRLLSAGQDMHVRLWRASDGKRLWERPTDGDGPVALHPDGRIVAIGDGPETVARQGKIRVVQLSDGAVLHTLDAHEHFVTGVEFSPDGNRLVSSGVGGFVRLWSTADGKLLQSARGAGKSFSFSADAKLLASGDSGSTGVYLWRFPELKLVYKSHTDPVMSLAFTPDASVLAVCTTTDVSPSLTLQLFRVSDGARLQTLVHETVLSACVAFSPRGKLLAAGMSDGTIRFFAPETETLP